MIPQHIKPLFWDTNLDNFIPSAYPEYTIARVLEYGDDKAVAWMKEAFPEEQIREVIRTESRLSPRSATFWALVFGIPEDQVAALRPRS
jgi:Family of unknown function (DUF6922)